MENPLYVKKYGEVTREIKTEPILFFKIYFFVFLVRRSLLWLIIVFLGDYVEIQIAAVCITNGLQFAWVLISRPFKRWIMNFIEIYIEFIALIVSLSLYLFLIFPDEIDAIGIYIIIAWITAVLASSIISFAELIWKIKEWCNNQKTKRKISNTTKTIETLPTIMCSSPSELTRVKRLRLSQA